MSEADFWSVKYTEALVDREAADIRFVMAFGAKVSKDGNSYCVLIGDNLVDGFCAFGDTPIQAIRNIENEIRGLK